MKKTRLIAAFAACALVLSGCGKKAAMEKVVAKAGDLTVTVSDMSILMDPYMLYGYDFQTAKESIGSNIENIIKLGAIGEAMKIEITEDMKEQIIMEKAWYAKNAGGLSAFKERLEDVGSSIDFVEKYAKATMLASEVQTTIQSEIETVEITDEELSEYFVNNYYRAKHILIPVEAPAATEAAVTDTTAEGEVATEAAATEATAEATEEAAYGKDFADKLLERAKNGENFDELITEYSTDPGSMANPDGYIFTKGEMVEAFENCVKGLEPGEFGICESDFGYHIIQRLPLAKDDAKFNEWFETSKVNVESIYTSELFTKKVDELCEKYNIKVEFNKSVVDAFTEDMYTPVVDKESLNAY